MLGNEKQEYEGVKNYLISENVKYEKNTSHQHYEEMRLRMLLTLFKGK